MKTPDEIDELLKGYVYDAVDDIAMLDKLHATVASFVCPTSASVLRSIKFRSEGRDRLVPDNFYTAILMACVQSGCTIPTPEELEDRETFETARGTFAWDATARCLLFTPVMSCDHIVIDVIVKESGIPTTPEQ